MGDLKCSAMTVEISDWGEVPTEPGVYCMYDVDETPVYVGEAHSNSLKGRLKNYFMDQTASAVSYGRLDLHDIWYIKLWTTASDEAEVAEQLLHEQLNPVFSSATVAEAGSRSTLALDVDTPDAVFYLLTEDEAEAQRNPRLRIQQKVKHIETTVSRSDVALEAMERGTGSRAATTKEALDYHLDVLEDCIGEYYEQWQ